jgi:hypothetical protein
LLPFGRSSCADDAAFDTASTKLRGVTRGLPEIGFQSCGQHQRRLQSVRETVDDLGVGRHRSSPCWEP